MYKIDVTKKEVRHELYKKALEYYTNPEMINHGLCYAIEQAGMFLTTGRFITDGWWTLSETRLYPSLYASDDNTDFYPEITRHKPEEFHTYWWPTWDQKVRIFILMQAIEETKP